MRSPLRNARAQSRGDVIPAPSLNWTQRSTIHTLTMERNQLLAHGTY